MRKVEWKKLCNFTKSASGKRRLGKKELGDLMSAQIALGNFKKKENWQGKPKTQSIRGILKGENV